MAPVDEPIGDEAVDQPGHPAAAEEDAVGELVHPEPPARRLGQLEQGGVLGERELVLGAQVVVEASAEQGMGGQERPPRPQAGIPGGQGPGRDGSRGGRGGGSHRRA